MQILKQQKEHVQFELPEFNAKTVKKKMVVNKLFNENEVDENLVY